MKRMGVEWENVGEFPEVCPCSAPSKELGHASESLTGKLSGNTVPCVSPGFSLSDMY